MSEQLDIIWYRTEVAQLKAEVESQIAGREIERLMIRNAVVKLDEKDEAIQVALRNLIANDAALKQAAKQIAERDATIERVRALATAWTDDFMTRDVTHDDRDDRADARDDCAMDIRAALDQP